MAAPAYLDDAQNGSAASGLGVRWQGRDLPREWFAPEWLCREAEWRLFGICYEGGRKFIESANPLTLFSHERESDRSYADRRRRAFYRNHPEAIISLKADAIYQPQVLRNQAKAAPGDALKPGEDAPPRISRAQAGDASLEAWCRDVDGKGTNADPWWNETARWAMAYGLEWAGIAMTSAPDLAARAQAEGRAITDAEAQAAGVRPYLYRAPPLSVIDWQADEQGRLIYATLLCRETSRAPLAKRPTGPVDSRMPAVKTRLIARILYRDREERYEIGERSGQTLIAVYPHPFGDVPLIPVTVRADGRSQIEDIARLAIASFNEDSMVEEQIFRQTFNQLVAKVKERDAFMDNVTGTDSLLCIGVDEALEYLAPQVQTITTIRERTWELVDEMYAIANLRSRPGGKGSQPATETSGVAYAFEHKQAETDLCGIAVRLEEAELKIGAMRARALGLDPAGYTCQYPRSFDVRALLTRAAEVQQLRAAGMGPKALAEALKNLVRQALPRLSAAKLEEIDAEIDERAAAGTLPGQSAQTPPDQSLQPPGAGAGGDRTTRAALSVGDPVEVD